MEPSLTQTDVVVVGGGVAGLTAACFLAREGVGVILFEKSPILGGRAATLETNGFLFNRGGHALYTGGAASRVFEELGVSYGHGTPKDTFVLHDGKLSAFPADPMGLLRLDFLDARDKLALFRFFAALGKVEPSGLATTSVQDWLERKIRRKRRFRGPPGLPGTGHRRPLRSRGLGRTGGLPGGRERCERAEGGRTGAGGRRRRKGGDVSRRRALAVRPSRTASPHTLPLTALPYIQPAIPMQQPEPLTACLSRSMIVYASGRPPPSGGVVHLELMYQSIVFVHMSHSLLAVRLCSSYERNPAEARRDRLSVWLRGVMRIGGTMTSPILVTGGTGTLGRLVVRRLRDAG